MAGPANMEPAANGDEQVPVKEGLAYILVPKHAANSMDPKKAKDDPTQVQAVFYNPIQQFNRDLSVLAIKAFGEDLVASRRKLAEDSRKRKARGKAAKSRNKQQSRPDVGNGHVASDQDQTSKRKLDEASGASEEASAAKRPKPSDHKGQPSEHDGAESGKIPQPEGRQSLPSSWVPRFTILDALSATGLRALRYAKEIPFVSSITANDLLAKATRQITINAKHNAVDDKIRVVTGNALSHMYSFAGDTQAVSEHAGKYDVIDLDPYGTAAPFLDASLHALNDGGLLCVTCTDAGVWASNGYPEKAFALYGGTPLKGFHSHEAGLRLILHSIATSAARQGMAIEPLLSLSIDYYARTFVRVRRAPAEVKFLAGKTMLVYNCDAGCGAWTTQFIARNDPQTSRNGQRHYKHTFAQAPSATAFCEHCGFKTHLAGPMYGGPLHNPAFVRTILAMLPDADKETYQTKDRIEGMLTTALEEIVLLEPETDTASPATAPPDQPATPLAAAETSSANQPPQPSRIPQTDPATIERHPFFFTPSTLAKVLHCQAPSEAAVKGALLHAGYRVSRSHTKPGTIKTTAPWSFIWRLMREWIRQKAPIKDGAVKEGTAGWKILRLGEAESEKRDRERRAIERQDCEAKDVVFDEALGKKSNQRGKLVRYQVNPRENWGPMGRAKGGRPDDKNGKKEDSTNGV